MNNGNENELSRVLYLSSDIDNESTSKIITEILKINEADDASEGSVVGFKREPIKLYVQSFGGSVYDCWALIDIMINTKTPIYTYCTGYAMSCGFLIFLAGDKRFASKHSTFMYHQISIGYDYMEYTRIKEDMHENEFLQGMMERMVLERTYISEDRLREVREKKIDWYIHLAEAVELGVVTEVM